MLFIILSTHSKQLTLTGDVKYNTINASNNQNSDPKQAVGSLSTLTHNRYNTITTQSPKIMLVILEEGTFTKIISIPQKPVQ